MTASTPEPGALRPWLVLLRVGTLFSPAADVLAGAAIAGLTWDGDQTATVPRAMLASVLVYAAGMVLNDHADRAEDAVQRPERPIPSGRIRPWQALAFGLVLLGGAIAVSSVRPLHGLLAVLVLGYDYVAKRRIELAAPTMGTLRALNLATGAAVVLGSFPTSATVWTVAGGYFAYIVALTVLGNFEDDPRVRPRAVVGVQSIPPIVAPLALLALPYGRPAALVGFLLAAPFLWRVRRRGAAWDRAAIRGSMTWLLLGTMLFTSLIAAGSGRLVEAAAILAVVPIARRIARAIALT